MVEIGFQSEQPISLSIIQPVFKILVAARAHIMTAPSCSDMVDELKKSCE